ncbi:MAG: cysteine desulfurase sulfur acceptor subunit CsdE [Candidatus Phlomobacter fragariae]
MIDKTAHFLCHPFGQEITLTELIKSFTQTDQWENKYRLLIQLARQFPTLPTEYKTVEIEVNGCENRVWLGYQQNIDHSLHFYGDSEGRIIKGLLAILLCAIEGKTAAQILSIDLIDIFKKMGLIQQLSTSRVDGIQSLVKTCQKIAQNEL